MSWQKSVTVQQAGNRIYRRLVRNCEDLARQTHSYILSTIDTPAPPHSRPGEPAHRFSGEMYASQRYEVNAGGGGWNAGNAIVVEWSNGSKHAGWTEFGTKASPGDKSGYDPRPWFRPAMVFSIDVFMVPTLTKGF